MNAGIGDLEEPVDRGLTLSELEAVATELAFRKPKPKVLALTARIVELVEKKGGSS